MLQQVFPAVVSGGFKLQPLGGLSNQSWRIDCEAGNWLARGETAQGRQMGIARQREFRVLRHLQGIVPRALCWRDGWLLVEWLSGEVLNRVQFFAWLHDGGLATRLAELHHRPRYGYPLPLTRLLEQHWQNMAPGRRTPKLRRAYQRITTRRLPAPLHIAPLHLDVHAGNLVATASGYRLIDWEYAADGDIALELALLFRSAGLSRQQQQDFLHHYCACWPGLTPARLLRHVIGWYDVVDYLVLMWCEVRWQQSGEEIYRQMADHWQQ
ncbi:Thiamine kinase @ Adenosylcobinamide kinase [Dickeya aquatica]|uniref:Thiamine kinase @ Adenosylcobinamide kinase n=1 Tax=Dickeya aquatica TaxID=1401087 RepID=A0A375ADK3_9GAMM|nr:Thiamine kinase @ Adenosylcobinamide kinase [Dickeya aquatica]